MPCYPRIAFLAVLLVGALIVLCSGTMLLVTVPSSLAAGDAFGPRYSDAAAAIAAQRTRDILSVLIEPYRALAHGTASGLLPIFTSTWSPSSRRRDMARYLFAMRTTLVALGGQLKDISAGFSDRTYLNCITLDANNETGHKCYMIDPSRWTVNVGTRFDWTWIGHNMTAYPSQTVFFNPRTLAWYVEAPKDNRSSAYFSSVYIDNDYESAVVDVTSPLFGPPPTKRFLGITSITLDLGRLSRFLNQIPGMTPGTEVHVVDNLGYLVGTSRPLSPIWSRDIYNTSGFNASTLTPNCSSFSIFFNVFHRVYCRYDGSDFPNSTALNALWRNHRSTVLRNVSDYGPYGNDSAMVVVNTSSGRSMRLGAAGVHFVSVTPVSLIGTENLNWLAVVLVPERDVVGAMQDGAQTSMYTGAGAAGLACMISALLLVLILRPLVHVAEQMADAATLQDEHLPGRGPRSVFREVRAVQCAMYQLCGQLKKAKKFLPASMLAQLTFTEDGLTTHTGVEPDDEDEGTVSMTPRGLGFSDSCVIDPHNGVVRELDVVSSTSRRHSESHSRGSGPSQSSRQRLAAVTGTASQSARTSASSYTVGDIAELNLEQRLVSVVAANVRGFHRDVRECGRGVLLGPAFQALVAAAEAAASEHRGVLDSFHGDRFFLTFNAVKPCSSHATLAMKAALQLTAAATSGPFVGRMTAGVAFGASLVGNMGSAAQRRFGVVGPAFTQAAALERLTRLYPGTHVLTAGSAAKDAESAVELLHLDVVALPVSNPLSCNSPNGDACTAAIVRLSSVRALRSRRTPDEWMCPLQPEAEVETDVMNRAFCLAQDGRHEDAAAVLLNAAPPVRLEPMSATITHDPPRGDVMECAEDATAVAALAEQTARLADEGDYFRHVQRLLASWADSGVAPRQMGDYFRRCVADFSVAEADAWAVFSRVKDSARE